MRKPPVHTLARLLAVPLVLLGSAAQAQRPTQPRPAAPPPQPTALTIARVQYGGGGDWYLGPSTLPNLLTQIRERTGIPVTTTPATVRLTDAALWDHPLLYMTGHGNVSLTDEEVTNLRRHLLAGGFLLANDSYGMDASFRREIKRVFPDKELVELPRDHPIFRAFYEMPTGIPKVHEHDNKPPQGFGIFHEGRLVLFYAYESDIGDGWEDATVHNDPAEIREQAFRMGVNVFVYVLSQRVG
jgi:hypothetical protein